MFIQLAVLVSFCFVFQLFLILNFFFFAAHIRGMATLDYLAYLSEISHGTGHTTGSLYTAITPMLYRAYDFEILCVGSPMYVLHRVKISEEFVGLMYCTTFARERIFARLLHESKNVHDSHEQYPCTNRVHEQ